MTVKRRETKSQINRMKKTPFKSAMKGKIPAIRDQVKVLMQKNQKESY